MLKSELTGQKLKKLLGAHSASYRWHNKNKSGGNFGINIYFGEQFVRGRDKEITGNYNTEGEITSLDFGEMYWGNQRLPKFAFETIEWLVSYIKLIIGWENSKNPSPPVTRENFIRLMESDK